MPFTPSLAAYQLGEAYAAYTQERPGLKPLEIEFLACQLDARPALLEAAWSLWAWEMVGWTAPQINAARSWLDRVLIGGLPFPDGGG